MIVGPTDISTEVTISVMLTDAPWVDSIGRRSDQFTMSPNLVKIQVNDGELGWVDLMGKKIKSNRQVGVTDVKIMYLGRIDLHNGEMPEWLREIVVAELNKINVRPEEG